MGAAQTTPCAKSATSESGNLERQTKAEQKFSGYNEPSLTHNPFSGQCQGISGYLTSANSNQKIPFAILENQCGFLVQNCGSMVGLLCLIFYDDQGSVFVGVVCVLRKGGQNEKME